MSFTGGAVIRMCPKCLYDCADYYCPRCKLDFRKCYEPANKRPPAAPAAQDGEEA